jgi:hypothetical protein
MDIHAPHKTAGVVQWLQDTPVSLSDSPHIRLMAKLVEAWLGIADSQALGCGGFTFARGST